MNLTKPLEDDNIGKEGICLFVDCPHCGSQGKNKICEVGMLQQIFVTNTVTLVVVPGFGICVIMAFTCETCGAKSNEIKPGGGYKDHGKRWKLYVSSEDDLNRDVIISDTATVIVEHLNVEVTPGTIGSAFTSVEGLIVKLVEVLERNHPFLIGDSVDDSQSELKNRIKQLSDLTKFESGQNPFIIVIDDPADCSFIGNRRFNQTNNDENLHVKIYQRTAEQDDELGLTGMKTEDY